MQVTVGASLLLFKRQKAGYILIFACWKLKNSPDCICRYLRNSLAPASATGVRRIELSSI